MTAVDIIDDTDPERAGEVAWFTGHWVLNQPPATRPYDGALVVRLTRPTNPLNRDHAADIEMLLAYQNRWQRVGQWVGVDDRWSAVVAPTAAAIIGLHSDVAHALARPTVTLTPVKVV